MADLTKIGDCPKCGGKGWKLLTVRWAPGDEMKVKEWCEKCKGTGKIKPLGEG